MSDPQETEKRHLEQAIETLVYAPIGLLFEGTSLLPQLVEKGRMQVTMARMVGQFAVKQGQSEAAKAAAKLQEQAAGVLGLIGGAVGAGSGIKPTPPSPEQPLPDAAPDAEEVAAPRPTAPRRRTPSPAREVTKRVASGGSAPSPSGSTGSTPATAAEAPETTGPPARAVADTGARGAGAASAPVAEPPAVEASTLAIPDYDGLSASHVVNRLAGLSSDELEAVRRYEALNRGRKTILSKIAQLQSS